MIRITINIILIISVTLFANAQTATVSISPASQQIYVGEIATVKIRVSDIVDLYAYEMKITYNTSKLRCESVAKLSFLPQGGTFFTSLIDSLNGWVTINEAMLGTTGQSGSGFLAEIRFNGRSGGVSSVEFSSSDFRDPQNQPITVTLQNGSITIDSSRVSVTVNYSAGWNLLSNPVTREPGTIGVRHLFPASLFNYAFFYEQGQGYQQSDTMINGKAYWVKFSQSGSVNIIGTARILDVIAVQTGWNLIGSITNPVNTSSITGPISSPWFGYNGGYQIVTQLMPGKGYWVKCSSAGTIIMGGTEE